MNEDKLLDAMGEIDDDLIRPPRRGRSWRWAAVIAAAFAAAAALVFFLPGKISSTGELATESFSSLEEVQRLYGGRLLAGNLESAGAVLSGIELEHRRDTDVSDASGWDSLRIAGELDGESLELSCSFNGPESSAQGVKLKRNGVAVTVEMDPEEVWEGKHRTRASFELDGVYYDLTVYVREMDDIYKYLDMVMLGRSISEKDETPLYHPFDTLMGFEDYRVEVEGDSFFNWHFYVAVDGAERCVAEVFGFPDSGMGAYSVDLDGDGVPEVVTNNIYGGDGVTEVKVYRYFDGDFWVGEIPASWLEDLGFEDLAWVQSVSQRYDPEKNVFEVINYAGGGERRETFTGLGPLRFRRFAESATDHMGYLPLTYDELEPTDARPVENVLGQSGYKVGIEHTDPGWDGQDWWHFWVELDGRLTCVAEVPARPGEEPEVYSSDIDGDGTPELISILPESPVGGIVSIVSRGPDGRLRDYGVNPDMQEEIKSHGPEGTALKTVCRFDRETGRLSLDLEDYYGTVYYTRTVADLDELGFVNCRHSLKGEPEYFTAGDWEG